MSVPMRPTESDAPGARRMRSGIAAAAAVAAAAVVVVDDKSADVPAANPAAAGEITELDAETPSARTGGKASEPRAPATAVSTSSSMAQRRRGRRPTRPAAAPSGEGRERRAEVRNSMEESTHGGSVRMGEERVL